MLAHRRFARPITLACVTAAVALTPGAAQARPAIDPPVPAGPQSQTAAPEPSTVHIVREARTDGETTLALILSSSALLIAAGAAALGARDHRQVGRIAHPSS